MSVPLTYSTATVADETYIRMGLEDLLRQYRKHARTCLRNGIIELNDGREAVAYWNCQARNVIAVLRRIKKHGLSYGEDWP